MFSTFSNDAFDYQNVDVLNDKKQVAKHFD